jgi:hypothetical protein
MEVTRDNFDDVTGAGDERFHFCEGKWCGGVGYCKHLDPSVSFNNVPTTGRRGQISKREAGLLVRAPFDRD